MNRRFMSIAVVLFSAFFSLSSSGLATPSVVRAAGCTTIGGTVNGGFNNGQYQYHQFTFPVPFSAGDTISATWIFAITLTPVPGAMDVTLGGGRTSTSTAPFTVTVCSPGAKAGVPLPFMDGRCNQQADQTVAVYPDGKGGYQFYAIYQGVGYFAFRVSEQTLDDNPTKSANYLIAHNLNVWLYRLSDGSLLVTGIKSDGKLYSFNIGSCGAMETGD